MHECLRRLRAYLVSLLSSFGRSAERARRLRIAHESDTRPQAKWIAMKGPRLLWRAGNQLGKSRGLAKKLIHFARRTGPYADRRPGPVKILVMSFSREQMVPLHEKLWELLPKNEISESVQFEPGYGFRGKPPRITFTSGEGKGTVIIFATYKQGSRRAAGGTFDVVALDEPVEERIWGEIQPRVLHGDPGEIWMTFTPTPDSPPLDYLRKMVEERKVVEMVTDLTVANVTLTDGRSLLTQAQIDAFEGGLLGAEKDMRLRGGWDIVATERALDNWGPHCIGKSHPPAGAIVAVGIDHGAGSGKQAAALVAISDAQGLEPRVWLLGEHVADGFTTPDIDAQAILDMLQRAGLRYDDVDVWVGDRASGMNKYDVRKSNGDLRRQLARLVGRPTEAAKFIEVPYKWDGSVMYGFRLLNAMMGRREDGAVEGDKMGPGHFQVAGPCPKFANAAAKWKWNPKDREKDILDAVRYPVEKVVKSTSGVSFKMQYS